MAVPEEKSSGNEAPGYPQAVFGKQESVKSLYESFGPVVDFAPLRGAISQVLSFRSIGLMKYCKIGLLFWGSAHQQT
jgi:hypothetical protein